MYYSNSIINKWPHKWFGVWKEYGEEYKNCPSIKDFIYPEIAANYELNKITNYLTTSTGIVATSRSSFPEPFTKEILSGSISYRTDGVWVWLDDLPNYIKKYGVALPQSFLDNILRNDYKVIDWEGNYEELNWPSLESL